MEEGEEQKLHPAVRRVKIEYLAGITPPMKTRDLEQPRSGSLSPYPRTDKALSPYCANQSTFSQTVAEQSLKKEDSEK
jgi:hypothetical protein